MKSVQCFDVETKMSFIIPIPDHYYRRAIKDPIHAEELLEIAKKCYEDEEKSGAEAAVKYIHVWTGQETCRLIKVMYEYLEDLKHPMRRENVFEQIANELMRGGFTIDAKTAQKKWNSLLKGYKKYKVEQISPVEIPLLHFFINEMDDLLGDQPIEQFDYSDDCGTEAAPKNSYVWSYDETYKLIEIMANYLEDIKSSKKRKHVFELVAITLNIAGVAVDGTNVQNKWKSLCRSYTKNKKTNRGQSQFPFLDAMDKLLENTSTPTCSFQLDPDDFITLSGSSVIRENMRKMNSENSETDDSQLADFLENSKHPEKRKNSSELFAKAGDDEVDEEVDATKVKNPIHDNDHPVDSSNDCDIGTSDTINFVKEEGKRADEIHTDKNCSEKEENFETILNSDYLRLKKQEYAKRQQRHEERMEVERRKLKMMGIFMRIEET